MAANLEKIVEELSALSVLEAAELVKALEVKWGVSAAAPVAAAGDANLVPRPADGSWVAHKRIPLPHTAVPSGQAHVNASPSPPLAEPGNEAEKAGATETVTLPLWV